MFYVCGYRAEWYQGQSPVEWPPASGIAVCADDDRFILFDIADEELMVKSETVAPDVRIFTEEKSRSMTGWIVNQLKEEGWIPSVAGLEMWSYRPNRLTSEAFQKDLEKSGCRVVDGSRVVKTLRSSKSEAELKCIEKAAEIADVGTNAAIDFMRPGVTELQVYGEIIRAMAAAGGENPGITIPVISGTRCPRLHALASRKKIARGEIVNIDVSGVFNRYHSNMARTLSVGKPNKEVERAVELSAGSFGVIRGIIRPGLGVGEFMQVLKAYYERVGIENEKLWYGGYELGLAFPPDWVGTFVYDFDVDLSKKKFVPGMAVNYESNFFLPRKAGASILINTIIFRHRRAKILGKIQNNIIVV
jgi:Xaa-Pro aminopeptidase